MIAIHIAADVPQNHIEDEEDGEDEQSHQYRLGHRRNEGLHDTRGEPPPKETSWQSRQRTGSARAGKAGAGSPRVSRKGTGRAETAPPSKANPTPRLSETARLKRGLHLHWFVPS